MLKDWRPEKVYIACGYTDMRRGIDGLASLVLAQFQLDPYSKAVFIFCGRRRDRIKLLQWEGDGFVLAYKRLENGYFQWPQSEEEVKSITKKQYERLLNGFAVVEKKTIQDLKAPQLF